MLLKLLKIFIEIMTISICHPKNGTNDCSRFVILEIVWHPEKGRAGKEAGFFFLSYVD